MGRVFQSLLQSDFGDGRHGNFEAVVLDGDRLDHWWRDNANGNVWKRGQNIVPAGAAAPGSIVQSDFTHHGHHGNFEVVVPVFAPDSSMDLWHYYHDNSDTSLPWQRAQQIASNVASSGSIIQSDFGYEHKNFEVVVPLVEGSQINLWHFWRENDDTATPWHRGQRIAIGVTGPAVFIQSDFLSGDHGNFELVVPIGPSLIHFWRDNSDTSKPWQRGQMISDAATGWGCIIQSDFDQGGHGNFEVLVDECSQSLVSY